MKTIIIIGIIFMLLIVGCTKADVSVPSPNQYTGSGCGVKGIDINVEIKELPMRWEV